MLAQDSVLDERGMVLLVDRHEHPHDVTQEMRAAFRHAVEKRWLLEPLLREIRIQSIEIVAF